MEFFVGMTTPSGGTPAPPPVLDTALGALLAAAALPLVAGSSSDIVRSVDTKLSRRAPHDNYRLCPQPSLTGMQKRLDMTLAARTIAAMRSSSITAGFSAKL